MTDETIVPMDVESAIVRLTEALDAVTPDYPLQCACIYPAGYDAYQRPRWGLNNRVCSNHSTALRRLGMEARRSVPVLMEALGHSATTHRHTDTEGTP